MNRATTSSRAEQRHKTQQQLFTLDEAVFTHETSSDWPHCVFAPLHYEPNYAYPLLVWLHGPKDDERQLLRIMPSISVRNYVAVAPRGLVMGEEEQESTSGFRASDLTWPQTRDGWQAAESAVLDCVSTVSRKFHISPTRIFLAGFGTGGTMAFRIALNQPNRFAGSISLGGPLPEGDAPLRQFMDARNLSVFLGIGKHSPFYSESQACDNLSLLHAAGFQVTLRLYPCGQEVTPQMLRDLDRWIIEEISASADIAKSL